MFRLSQYFYYFITKKAADSHSSSLKQKVLMKLLQMNEIVYR